MKRIRFLLCAGALAAAVAIPFGWRALTRQPSEEEISGPAELADGEFILALPEFDYAMGSESLYSSSFGWIHEPEGVETLRELLDGTSWRLLEEEECAALVEAYEADGKGHWALDTASIELYTFPKEEAGMLILVGDNVLARKRSPDSPAPGAPEDPWWFYVCTSAEITHDDICALMQAHLDGDPDREFLLQAGVKIVE